MTNNASASATGVVAGLFAQSEQGERSLSELKAAGFSRVEISAVSADSAPDATDAIDAPAATPRDDSQGSRFFREHDATASSFVKELADLGFSKKDAHDLVDGLTNGGALVTADAGAKLDEAVAILRSYGADIRYGRGGVSATPAQIETPLTERTDSSDERALQLRAEQLVVDKQRVRHGDVRVHREIVTEVRSIDVPVTHEELVIERHAISGDAAANSAPIENETIRIPLTEEQISVSKATVVREEVAIGKRIVQETAHINESVRHEELRVDEFDTNNTTRGTTP